MNCRSLSANRSARPSCGSTTPRSLVGSISKLVALIAEAIEVRELVLASPELSLNQLGKREGRCRTQLGRLLRLSWLSPRIVESIIDGRQPVRLDRRMLLEADLPLCWQKQEQMLGFAM